MHFQAVVWGGGGSCYEVLESMLFHPLAIITTAEVVRCVELVILHVLSRLPMGPSERSVVVVAEGGEGARGPKNGRDSVTVVTIPILFIAQEHKKIEDSRWSRRAPTSRQRRSFVKVPVPLTSRFLLSKFMHLDTTTLQKGVLRRSRFCSCGLFIYALRRYVPQFIYSSRCADRSLDSSS